MIAGPNEQNPAALAALARTYAGDASKTHGARAATLAAATAQSLGCGPVDARRRSIRARR